jgi:hypothetical protein
MNERVPRRSVADAVPAALAPAQAWSASPFASAHYVSDLSARTILDALPPTFTPLHAAAAAFAHQLHRVAVGNAGLLLREWRRTGAGWNRSDRDDGCHESDSL